MHVSNESFTWRIHFQFLVGALCVYVTYGADMYADMYIWSRYHIFNVKFNINASFQFQHLKVFQSSKRDLCGALRFERSFNVRFRWNSLNSHAVWIEPYNEVIVIQIYLRQSGSHLLHPFYVQTKRAFLQLIEENWTNQQYIRICGSQTDNTVGHFSIRPPFWWFWTDIHCLSVHLEIYITNGHPS